MRRLHDRLRGGQLTGALAALAIVWGAGTAFAADPATPAPAPIPAPVVIAPAAKDVKAAPVAKAEPVAKDAKAAPAAKDAKAAPAAKDSKAGPVVAAKAPVPVPVGIPWTPYKFGTSAAQLRKTLGKGVEPLKAAYRLGDYKADFRGAPVQITKGVAMRPLPLFDAARGTLEMVILTNDNARGRDFAEMYTMLTRTYGAARQEHSQFRGPKQVFDVNWKTRSGTIALYFDEAGRLMTLELARATALTAEPYGEAQWLRASEWATICGCDFPLYYNRCPSGDGAYN